jgi:ubiquinone biosynthesis protein
MIGSAKRISRITSILMEEGFGLIADAISGNKEVDLDGVEKTLAPKRIKDTLEKLGPTFVKFGQILGARRDLFPDAYCDELEKLQAEVAPFSSSQAKAIVETELGQPVEKLFKNFYDIPLSAASLAQVHEATLHTGESVVVKIQRPDAMELVEQDLSLLLSLSSKLKALIPLYRKFDVDSLARYFAMHAREELNFFLEIKNAEKLRKCFINDSYVNIPKIHDDYCTEKILVLEKVNGARFDRLAGPEDVKKLGLDPEFVVINLLKLVYEQAYLYGVLHADMHGGNMFLQSDGSITLIDFGLVSEVTPEMQRNVLRALLYMAMSRWDDAVECALNAGDNTHVTDMEGLRRAYREHYRTMEGKSLSEFTIAQSLQEEGKIGARFGVKMPQEFLMLARALITVESICIRLAPDLNVAKTIQPIALNVMFRRIDINTLLEEASSLLPEILTMIELAPAFHRNLLKLERLFAERPLEEFLPQKSESQSNSSIKSIVAAGMLVFAAIPLLIPVPGMTSVVGVPWLTLVALSAAAFLALKK